ncbi:MAG: helix-turn-helix transcriptional regulator [Solirubrobacteraceae bacterium]
MRTRVTSSRLIGRTPELAELEAALADASRGRPSVAFVAGESGVGKTRLATELARRADATGARVLIGECVELGEGELPYAPIVAALRSLTRDGDPVLGELDATTRAGLAGLLPEIGGDPDRADPAQARVFEALLTLLEALGRAAPLLLTIEDLHWADASTRSFLTFLARSLRAERVLVVATYRSDELHRRHPLRPLLAELERGPRARRVDLSPLSRDELADQLADILGGTPDAALVDRLHARSEGNPLFTEELLAAGLDGRGELPPTLRDALMVRIETLCDASQELLRLLAVGGRMDHALLAAASGLDSAKLREALRDAVAGHIVVAGPDARYRFRHALLREVVADDLLPGEDAELNLAIARALDARAEEQGLGVHLAAGIAHHYLAAGDRPAALRASVVAARAAERVKAHNEAAGLYERALELWPRVDDPAALADADRATLLEAAAGAHTIDGDATRAEALFAAALEEIDERAEPHRAAALLEHLASTRWRLTEAENGRRTLDRALALLPEGDVSVERARLLALGAKFDNLRGKWSRGVEAAREALAVADAVGDPGARTRALNALGSGLMGTGRIDEGAAHLRAAMEVAKAAGLEGDVTTAYVNHADFLHLAARSAEAAELAAEGEAWAAERRRPLDWLALMRAEIAFDRGDWAFAAGHIPEKPPMHGVSLLNWLLRGTELSLGLGEHAEARAHLDRVDRENCDLDEPQFLGVLGALRAELERRSGDLEAARAAVSGALDRIETCTDDVVRLARVSAVGAAVEADAAQRARDVGDPAGESLALAELALHVSRAEAAAAGGGPVEAGWHLTVLAEQARAAGTPDPALWRAAAEAWATADRAYLAALTRWREAEALAAGDREAAAAVASAARAAAERIGARWLLSELDGLIARARLPVAGAAAPPEPMAAEDPFGLTPRERQVLALVADGRTNREIGETLFMAEKTASVHVSRILGKLDVRTRTEAAALAHRQGLDAAPTS